jgi:hypothetical protein
VKGASVISLVMTIIAPLLRVLITLIVCVSYFHRVKSSRQAQGSRVLWSLEFGGSTATESRSRAQNARYCDDALFKVFSHSRRRTRERRGNGGVAATGVALADSAPTCLIIMRGAALSGSYNQGTRPDQLHSYPACPSQPRLLSKSNNL